MNQLNAENTVLDGVLVNKLAAEIKDVFEAVHIQIPSHEASGTIVFIGNLLLADSEKAYDTIAARWHSYQYTPLLSRNSDDQIALTARPGLIVPTPSNPWINLLLGILTILSVQLTGAVYECGCFPNTLSEWSLGFPMMLVMMSILLAHEFGHYFAARYHKVAVTLPYFIPIPPPISPVGTLGAFIQLRSPFRTKRELFDIGVAGPIGGLILTIPFILLGIATSSVDTISRQPGAVLEGNSIFYLGLKYLLHGELLPSFEAYESTPFLQEFGLLLIGSIPPSGGHDLFINSVAWAAWFGLFVTALNLLPVGQLDGGHIIYCLLGHHAKWFGTLLVGLMILAGIFIWSGWLLWALLVFFVIGTGHPKPLNDLVPLDKPRQILAYAMIFIFFLIFMLNPLQPM